MWRPGGERLAALCLAAATTAALGVSPAAAQTAAEIASTAHNLSVSGPGDVRALTETRICVFCHTPHNATPGSPLWNRELEPQTYQSYTSPTLDAGPLPPPSGPTKLCLSCHDGTVALGAVMEPPGGIAVSGGLGPLSRFDLDLSNHHPVSFPYPASAPELASPPPDDLLHGGDLHCSTCHDPHRDPYGKFLVADNRFSALCTRCHEVTGWQGSAHARSTASVVGVLPRPPKTSPEWTQLGEWGCQACHTPHFAPTPQHLLSFSDAFSCTSAGCHGAGPGGPHLAAPAAGSAAPVLRSAAAVLGGVDIETQVRKASAHRPPEVATGWSGGATATGAGAGVSCSACHDPHQVNDSPAEPPLASGLLAGVAGIDRNGMPVEPVTYGYEVCLKCHGDTATDLETVPRVVASVDTRRDFAVDSASFHPVFATSGRGEVPSLGTVLEPGLVQGQQIACTDCHADDSGSRGPHGSDFPPLLRERYDLAPGSLESPEAYALCYRCHDRSSILADQSFRRAGPGSTTASGGGHSGHLGRGATCATCHDPHGVPSNPGDGTGSHSHLVNFDLRVVQPVAGATVPVFRDDGTFSGSCTLVCHGVEHRDSGYR